MTTTPSFLKIDYSLRTNKNIERKLVFERLNLLSSAFAFPSYRYLGLGSMWFVDFVLAHRLLGISTLWSFERTNAERAEYNKPYACIKIKPGSVTAGLDGMTPEDWAEPAIVWLDYDGLFDEDSRGELRRLLERLRVGSVVIATVNAERRGYKGIGPADTSPPVIERLRTLFGDSVPASAVPVGQRDVTPSDFPAVFSDSILAFMTSAVRQSGRATDGRPDRFVPMFDLRHQDGALMATVGGLIVTEPQLGQLSALLRIPQTDLLFGAGVLRDIIDLIPITSKEKVALDRLLPCDETDFTALLAASTIPVVVREALKYRRLYTHFPLFAETVG